VHSFSSKNISKALLLFNLVLLFIYKGGRDPFGLALYHALTLAAFWLAAPRIPFNNPVSKLLIAVLASWALSSAVNPLDAKGWVHGFAFAAHALNFFTFRAVADRPFIRSSFVAIALSSVVIALLALLGQGRMTIMPNSNLDATFLNFGILTAAFYLMSRDFKFGPRHLAAGLLLAFLLSGQFLLFSRGAALSLVAALAAGLLTDRKKVFRIGAFILIMLLLLVIFFEKPAASLASKFGTSGLTSRILVWRGGVEAFKVKPWLGWGLAGFERAYKRHRLPMNNEVGRYEKTTAFAHNEYLQIAVETGILGLLAWLALLFVLLKRGVGSVRKNPSSWEISASLACMIALLAHAAVDFNLHLPIFGFMFSFFAASTADLPEGESGYSLPAAIIVIWGMVSIYSLGTLWVGKSQAARAVRMNPYSRELLEKLMDLSPTADRVLAVNSAFRFHHVHDRPKAYIARAHFHKGELTEAAQAYEYAIEKNPTNPFYKTELADLCLKQRNVHAAAFLFSQALELEPFFIYPRFRLAEILAAEGKKREALEAFRQIQKIEREMLPANSEYTKRILETNPKAVADRIRRLEKERP